MSLCMLLKVLFKANNLLPDLLHFGRAQSMQCCNAYHAASSLPTQAHIHTYTHNIHRKKERERERVGSKAAYSWHNCLCEAFEHFGAASVEGSLQWSVSAVCRGFVRARPIKYEFMAYLHGFAQRQVLFAQRDNATMLWHIGQTSLWFENKQLSHLQSQIKAQNFPSLMSLRTHTDMVWACQYNRATSTWRKHIETVRSWRLKTA